MNPMFVQDLFGMEALKFHLHFQTQSVYFDPK